MKNVLSFTTLIIALLFNGLVFASAASSSKSKILIVLTSHTELGNTGKKTGFWLPELTHPYYEFTEAGFQVDVASIAGGMAPVDSKAFEEEDEFHDRFLNDPVLMAKVIRSLPLAEVNPDDYQAIMFAGGSGPMWDFPNNPDISRVSAAIYENNGIVSAVCHGTAALVDLRLSNGKLLAEGRRVSAFTNEEEASLGTTKIVPFLLQDKMADIGAVHISGQAWQENVVVDGRLVTGQNPASAKKAAQSIIGMLQQK